MSSVFTTDPFDRFRKRIANQVSVGRIDFAPLTTLDVKRLDLGARRTIVSDNGPAEHLFIVVEGWLFAHTSLSGGSRFVHRIYQPGDLIGTEDINWSYSTSSVTTATKAVVGRFPKTSYLDLFANTTRLGAALHTIGMGDQVVLVDTARANARLGGRDRLGHLLLTLEARQRLTTDTPEENAFRMPLTQAILADTVGLSLVHTSNELRKLQESGAVRIDDDRCEIVRRQELVARTGFQNRYVPSNPDWIERLSG